MSTVRSRLGKENALRFHKPRGMDIRYSDKTKWTHRSLADLGKCSASCGGPAPVVKGIAGVESMGRLVVEIDLHGAAEGVDEFFVLVGVEAKPPHRLADFFQSMPCCRRISRHFSLMSCFE